MTSPSDNTSLRASAGAAHFFLTASVICILASGFAGCRKQEPVSLIDPGTDPHEIEIENASLRPDAFEPESRDSTGFFPSAPRRYRSRLTLFGSEYDAPSVHHEASLAQAVFVNRSSPIVLSGDTIGYGTAPAGVVSIDNLPLVERPFPLVMPGVNFDSIGPHYLLLRRDGQGGIGFRYLGYHAYDWTVSGSAVVPAFSTDIVSPPVLHVLSLTPQSVVSLSQNLPVRWEGGGAVVRVLISTVRTGSSPKPVLQLRIRTNLGRAVLPARILQLLPDAPKFLFTFFSENSMVLRVPGYEEEILVRATTSHTILVNAQR